MRNIDFLDMSEQLCVIPGSTSQFININTLKPNDTMLIASFFDEENLEYVESQIMDLPEEGYDEVQRVHGFHGPRDKKHGYTRL